MGFFRKIVLLSILFALLGYLTFYLGYNENSNEQPEDQILRDLRIGEWKDRNLPYDQWVQDILQADLTVNKYYFKSNFQPVYLYAGYYNSLGKSKLSHAPEVCFTGQGWVINMSDTVDVKYRDSNVRVNRLILTKGDEEMLAYYWYQSGNKIFDNLFMMKLSLLFSKIINGVSEKGDNAFIRVFTPIVYDNQKSERQLQEFTEQLLPEIEKSIFSKKIL